MTIVISLEAAFLNGESEVERVARMQAADGLTSEECFSDFIGDGAGEEALRALRLKGGFLKLRFDAESKRLWSEVEYETERRLSDSEQEALIEYTIGQLADGIGDNLAQEYRTQTGSFISFAFGHDVEIQYK